jgi:hypothetical protein
LKWSPDNRSGAATRGGESPSDERASSTQLEKIKSLLRLAFHTSVGTDGVAGIERLPVPYTFNKGLGLRDALIAVAQAFLRILLTCFLFAVCGVFVLWSWNMLASGFWRWAMLASVFALFVLSFLALMIGISVIAKAVTPRKL